MKYIGGLAGDKYSAYLEKWFQENSGTTIDRRIYTYLMFIKGPRIAGAAIFYDFSDANCTFSVYAPKSLTRTSIKEMLYYPFVTLGVTKLFGEIQSDNALSQKVFGKIGFGLVSTVDDYHSKGVHRLIYCAEHKDIERWLPVHTPLQN